MKTSTIAYPRSAPLELAPREFLFYVATVLLAVGNVVAPALCHALGGAGTVFLPIFFFTLLGVCVFGWRVALFAAIASPLASSVLTGMPEGTMLGAVLFKSVTIVGLFVLCSRLLRGKLFAVQLIAIIAGTQLLGLAYETIFVRTASEAFRAVLASWPGLLIQFFGVFGISAALSRIEK